MSPSGIDRETGEFGGDEICVKCNPHIDRETGEWENTINKPFKIPSTKLEIKKPKTLVRQSCRNDHKYTMLLTIFTLIMFLPNIGVTVWILIQTIVHLCIHRKPHLMAKYRFQRTVMSQFCGVCQAERCNDVVGKLQDLRTNKMRQYVRNIPIGT